MLLGEFDGNVWSFVQGWDNKDWSYLSCLKMGNIREMSKS